MELRVFNLSGINNKISPLLHNPGQTIRNVNCEVDTVGGFKKRPGYVTYLGDLDAEITTLFDWQLNNGTQFWNYAVAGGSLFYSTQGTGAWTVCGNGTLTSGARPGHAVIDNTMVIGDGTAVTRHTTTGTSFTNTVSAPIANWFTDYQNRIWAGGTSSSLFYSTGGTPTDWATDSSSITIPGPGRINGVFKASDRVITSKNSGVMFRWDGYNLADLSTNLGPTSFSSIGSVEDFNFYLNRLGGFGFSGAKPEIISNSVEKLIYNDPGSGIVGTTFDNAPGKVHKYDWLVAVGTVTDDLTNETINNCILKYDFQLDDWTTWDFANLPTAWNSYKDASGVQQLIFGDSGGQCYTFGGTALDDNGVAVDSVLEGVLHFDAPDLDKQYNYVRAFANPGCQGQFMVAPASTFTKDVKNWISVGDLKDGFTEMRFPANSEGQLLFWKFIEVSRNSRFNFYGFAVSYDIIRRR